MERQRQKQPIVYKGTFISNERKKRPGGRVKCEEFKNKIEIMGKNQAIHESEVEWTEVRRYKRQKRDKRDMKKQDKKQDESKFEKKEQENKKGLKFQQKNQIQRKDIKEKYKQKNQQATKFQQKSQKYKQKNQNKIQQNQKTFKKNQKSNIETKISQEQPKKIDIQESDTTNENTVLRQVDQIRKQEEPQNESQEQNEDLQVIVGRIKRQTNIKFKTKAFVGILYFQKRKNRKIKKNQFLQNPIQQIMSDYFADLHPIHSRLPIMQLDDLNFQNFKVLNDYATKAIKKDKNINKKYLNQILDQLSSVYILMTFSDWDGDIPLGNIHKILGKVKTIDGQCQRFLYQHGLNDLHYDHEQLEQIKICPSPLHQKVHRMVFTIDPPTSTDLDDALSIQKIDQNLYSIGIHIADVSSYLHLIDRQQIAKRTTSVYLPYKVYHMLNRNLVKICSLDPNVERLAFTVWVMMDIDGNIIGESKLQKSIIKSRFKLSYSIVQDLTTSNMNYEEFNKKYQCQKSQYELLLQKLLVMTEIATNHREKRVIFDVFENRQLQFEVDKDRWPVECYVQKRYRAKKVVQQFMIIGNIQSAKVLVKSSSNHALVIHHPKPNKFAISQFNEQFKKLEIKLKFQNVFDVQRQLLQIEKDESISPEIKQILYFKARRSMEPAIYRKYGEIFDDDKSGNKSKELQSALDEKKYPIIHFALGLQFYTHFTSPMRRMADIIVHQSLNSILVKQQLKISDKQIQKINQGRRNTKRLKKDLNEVYLCLMIYHTGKPIQTDGIISSFGLESVSIYIPLFDMQKQILWRKQFKVYSVKRIRGQEDKLDIKLYHDPKSAKKDIYWVIERFQKVKLTLSCTTQPPLKLITQMTVQSEKGPFKVEWYYI